MVIVFTVVFIVLFSEIVNIKEGKFYGDGGWL